MRIRVRQQHINEGKPGFIGQCPIALAIKESLDENDITVVEDNVEIRGLKFRIPASVKQFVVRFDEGKPVKPFTFDLTTLKD